MSTPVRSRRYPLVSFIERRSLRQRRAALIIAAVAAVLWLATRWAGILLDRWWYDSVTEAPVWSTMTWARVQMAFVGGLVAIAVMGWSLRRVLRTEPAVEPGARGFWAGYRDRMGPAHRWLLWFAGIITVYRFAAAATRSWQAWLLLRHGSGLGVATPEIGHDLAFYLFDLPFLAGVSVWARLLLATAFGVSLVGYLASGALRIPGGERRSSPRAVAHLAFLVAAYAVVQGLHELVVRRPMLTLDGTGSFDGAGFTQVRVLSPVMRVLAVVAFAVAAMIVWSVRRRTWRPAVIGVGAWALLQLLGTVVLPVAVNRLVVTPAEADRQLPYLAHNLDATVTAYGLDRVDQRTVELADGVTSIDPAAASDIARIPVYGTDQLTSALQVLQGTTATRITDVDLDRYELDGEIRPMMVAARNASRGDLPESGWVQRHLVYTHGDGVVIFPADAPDADGRPDADAAVGYTPQRPELYFGENLKDWYAVVGTDRREVGGRPFSADTGVAIGSRWRRLVAATALGEKELFLSSEVGADAQLLYRRGINERLGALAPFLSFDADPYPVITDERVVWVVDGYTTARTYPYAQFARAGTGSSTGIPAGTNYLQASIKATIDAYDGTVHLYRTGAGEDDPILSTWERILPDLVEPIADMPADIAAHLRYPSDLLTVQTGLLGRYHVDSPETLFDGTERWSVSASAGAAVGDTSGGAAPPVWMFLPVDGSGTSEWVSVRPFSPGVAPGSASSRDELRAYVVASHDDPERIELVTVDSATGRQLSSPQVAQSAIDADPDLARVFTLLNANGSKVQFGPMTLVPLRDGVVWIRPVIVTGTATTTAPRVYDVVAVNNGIVGQGNGDGAVAAVEASLDRSRPLPG